MRKLILAFALIVTVSNLAVGLAYASICQGTGGARACGERCSTTAGGQCGCVGACSEDERKWVEGAHKLAELAEAEEYMY